MTTCVGKAGDVDPFMAIGLALRQHGHRVELATAADFLRAHRCRWLAFVPIGSIEDYHTAAADPKLWHPRRGPV